MVLWWVGLSPPFPLVVPAASPAMAGRRLFVTGIGTGVGKTVVSAVLVRALRLHKGCPRPGVPSGGTVRIGTLH